MKRFVDTQELLDKNAAAFEECQADRRGFLKSGLAFTAVLGFWTPELGIAAAPAAAPSGRELQFVNRHTGERFQGQYWNKGKYLPDAFSEIKTVLRDYRTGERFPIDPRLMDILYVLQHRINNFKPFDVVSGYRSKRTNDFLRHHSDGVARNSLHMSGQAIDLSLPGTSLGKLRNSALRLGAGGVGYYPSSDFVHLDTGRVRSW